MHANKKEEIENLNHFLFYRRSLKTDNKSLIRKKKCLKFAS